jgi:hypothetical protein
LVCISALCGGITHISESVLTDGIDVSDEANFFITGSGLCFVFAEPVVTHVVRVSEEFGVALKLGLGFVIGGGLGVITRLHFGDVCLKSLLFSLETLEFGFQVGDESVVVLDGLAFDLVVIVLAGDGVLTELDEEVDEALNGSLVGVLGNLNHAEDNWGDAGGFAGLVAGLEEALGLAADLGEGFGASWLAAEFFHEVDTLINGINKLGVVTGAVVVDFVLHSAGGVRVVEHGVGAFLFGAVLGKEILGAVERCSTSFLLVGGTLAGEFGIGDLSLTEADLVIAISSLLNGKCVMLSLFGADFVRKVIKHIEDVGDGSLGFHLLTDLHEKGLVAELHLGLECCCVSDS